MRCVGKINNTELVKEAAFVNEEGVEIFYGYRNDFAPKKMIINGCSGENNYIGETRHYENLSQYIVTENDKVVAKMERVPSLMPKCDKIEFERDVDAKFSIGLGSVKLAIVEKDTELISMTLKRREYVIDIKDGENPTLMVTMLMGVAEINNLTGKEQV